MIKSAALFARQPLHIHIFTEEDMAPLFEGELESWPDSVKARTEYSINTIDYSQLPQDLIEEWKRWYKPCGSFRLLTPMLLGQKVNISRNFNFKTKIANFPTISFCY